MLPRVRLTGVGALVDFMSEDEHRAQMIRFTRLAREGQQTPAYSPSEMEEEILDRRRSLDIEAREFVDLADGRRLVSEDRLGFSSRRSDVVLDEHGHAQPDPWQDADREDIEQTVRMVVRRDSTNSVDRWNRLREEMETRGVALTVAELEALPFVLELSDRLLRRLAARRFDVE